MAVSWQNVKDVVYYTLGDDENVEAFFTNATIHAYFTEAMYEAADRSLWVDNITDTVTVSGASDISATTGSLQVWRVEVDGEVCYPVTPNELRKSDRFWNTRTGKPRFYIMDEEQTNATVLTVRLHEIPNVSDLTVKIYAYGVPGVPSDNTPTLLVTTPEWFAYTVAFGILTRCYEADTEMQNFEKADFYRGIWNDAIGRLRLRSFGRLKRQWSFRPKGRPTRMLTLRNRIAETIPEPS